MRRATAWFVVVGVAVLGAVGPARAADGFWVSIAAGVAGSASPTAYQEWWFETPHAPPIAVTRLNGVSAEATTGGGSSFFLSGAVPVVLKPTDGYAYLAGTLEDTRKTVLIVDGKSTGYSGSNPQFTADSKTVLSVGADNKVLVDGKPGPYTGIQIEKITPSTVGGRYAVMGAQSPEVLADAIRKVAAGPVAARA